MLDINKAVTWIRSIAEDNSHGYSQYNRYGTPDYDCSSLVTAALRVAGANIPKNLTTYNMKKYLESIGYTSIPISDKREAGDIFLSVNHHVVMCVSRLNIVHASIDESGSIKGRIPGDQTGKEICMRSFYNPSYGWDYHFRYTGEKKVGEVEVNLKVIKKGMKDPEVGTVQILLKAKGYKGKDGKVLQIDNSAGSNTDFAIRAFQKKNSLEVDGVVGSNTWNKLLKG